MKLISTRHQSPEVDFKEALFQGLAPDGGLYRPAEDKSILDLFRGFKPTVPFNEIAEKVSNLWLRDEWDNASVTRIVERAFDFAPELRALGGGVFVLELFHGPSSAFKDFGACFLASCMEEVLKEKKRHAVVLVATSGDTGSAVARAFYKKKNIDVVILYPSGRVSAPQEKQLTTLDGNIAALEVKGSFDDCQRMVKEAFRDPELVEKLTLTSANSINIGRLFPQSFYYIDGAARLHESNAECVVFCVPSGNFGNLTAGVYAWKWGLPVGEFIAATNVNDVVPEYLKTSAFTPRPSVQTLSNAMDVGNPSNFERLTAVFKGNHRAMVQVIKGQVVTDEETKAAMREVYAAKDVFLDPHTAVGYVAARRYLAEPVNHGRKVIVLATAHPAKFLEIVEEATGKKPHLPSNLKKALSLPKKSVLVENTLDALKEFLGKHFGV
ncbi:MAG: threonine synthase [Spirochaetales bacterium]|nr:threonine synthase [Spirochaetales bacterium]